MIWTELMMFINIVLTIVVLVLLTKHLNIFAKKKGWLFFYKREITLSEYEEFISQLTAGLLWMSKNLTGALIVIEHKYDLQKYIQLGYKVRAKFTPEFLINIFFNKASALHDGGVIIRGLDIISVSSYFPITTNRMTTTYGSRHRAAAGITENTDAIALIVSETNGKVSIAQKGKLSEIPTRDSNVLSTLLFESFSFYIK